ncbi:MAG: aconitase X swivel domain-containing protein [Candidatus Helarchaeota archaeon]
MRNDYENRGELILKGRPIVPGLRKGRALVCTRALSAAGGIEPTTGKIIEARHPQRGENVRKTILVFPNGKGSSGFSLIFHALALTGNAPRAMVISRVNSLTALAAVAGNIPTIGHPFEMEKNPIHILKTGEKLLVNAMSGEIFRI